MLNLELDGYMRTSGEDYAVRRLRVEDLHDGNVLVDENGELQISPQGRRHMLVAPRRYRKKRGKCQFYDTSPVMHRRSLPAP